MPAKTSPLTPLFPTLPQLIDCAITSGACSGAPLHTGFKYAMANGGLTATTAYPYVGTPGSCNTVAAAWKVVQISGYEWLQPKNETELMRAVAQRVGVYGMLRVLWGPVLYSVLCVLGCTVPCHILTAPPASIHLHPAGTSYLPIPCPATPLPPPCSPWWWALPPRATPSSTMQVACSPTSPPAAPPPTAWTT